MKDIKRLSLQNFRTHERSDIEIDPGITAFVGESANGKTNVIRFMKWVLKNAPDGVGMIRRGETRAKGSIEFDDGTEVSRERSASINRYTVTKPDGETLSFNNFGRAVPPEVLEASEYTEVRIDGTTRLPIHFSDQLEGPFLVSLSSGDKGKVIDGLAKINKISMAMTATKREAKDLSNQRDVSVLEQSRLNERLGEYEQLEDHLTAVDQALLKLQEARQMEEELERLRYLSGRLSAISQNIEETERLIDSLEGVVESDTLLRQASLCGTQSDMLRRMVRRWTNTESELQVVRPIVQAEHQILGAHALLKNVAQMSLRLEDLKNLKEDYLDTIKAKGIAEPYLKRLRQVETASTELSKADALAAQIQAHRLLLQRKESNATEQRGVSASLSRLEGLVQAEKALANVTQDEILLENLKDLRADYIAFRTKIERGDAFLSALAPLQTVSVKIEESERVLSELQRLTTLRNQFLSGTEEARRVQAENHRIEAAVERAKQTYTDALREMKVCPVCSSEMNEEHLHQAYENL